MLEWRVWRGTAMVLLLSMSWLVNAEQVAITGSVVGPEGEPVAEATVMTKYRPSAASRDRLWAETTSGADGAFELAFECERPSPRYDVLVTKRGYALAWQRWKPGQMAQIALGANPATCAGIVVDAKGNPLAGIEVRVRWLELGEGGDAKFLSLGNFASPLATETDEKGRFEFEGLPGAAKVALAVRGEGWAYFVHIGPNVPRAGEEVEIRLYPEAIVSGRVTRNGERVGGVWVTCQPMLPSTGGGKAVTDDGGAYTINHLPAATYNVMLCDTDEWTAVAVEGVEVGVAEHAKGVDLQLIEGAIVEGTVTLADTGGPAVGVHIRADGPAGPTWRGAGLAAKTDERGHYEIRLAPGKNKVEPSPGFKGYRESQPREAWVEVANGERKTGVDFMLKSSPRVRGVLLNPDGAPAAGVSVWLAQDAFGEAGSEARRTDEEGRFEFTGRRHAREYGWVFFAQDPERDLAAVTIVKDLEEEVVVRLAQGAYVTSQVVDTDGNAFPDFRATLLVEDAQGSRRGTLPIHPVTDADGFLRVGPLPARVHLRILPVGEAAGYAQNGEAWHQRQLYLEPAATESLPTLRLNLAGRRLSGVVVDEQQQPVARAEVMSVRRVLRAGMQGVDGSGFKCDARATTDAQGRFELTGLSASGMVRLLAVTPDRERAFLLPCDPDLDVEPVLALRKPGVVMGVVYDAEGEPQADVNVRLHTVISYPHGDGVLVGMIGGLPMEAKTDERGRWRFEGLMPGTSCRVQAEDPARGISGDTGPYFLEIEGGDAPTVVDIYME